MKFCIITHVLHIKKDNHFYGYAPYVREINIWTRFVDNVILVAPIIDRNISEIDLEYSHDKIEFVAIDNINILSFSSIIKTLIKIPKISWSIIHAMNKSDHIHLRCPGNIGLIACIIQIFFPNKTKTAKYAGNWDLKAKQPLSYKIQKWILNNTFLTKNMNVLVYGEWENSSINIKPFFTASYYEKDKVEILKRDFDSTIKFIFVGSLTSGKNPLYVIKLIEKLYNNGIDVNLEIYGDGIEAINIKNYINKNKLNEFVLLKGNKNQQEIKKAFQVSHFLILPSKSEGWPKVVAEAMFWGCLPVSSRVSCIPFMLDYGKRGILLEMNLERDVQQLEAIIANKENYNAIVANGSQWSRRYTLDYFEEEIQKLLQS